MEGFVGRDRELGLLDGILSRVQRGRRAGRPGRALLMRGRRRVGKSRLVEEFVERAGVPYLFFTASRAADRRSRLALFVEAAVASTLPGAQISGEPATADLGRRAHPARRRAADRPAERRRPGRDAVPDRGDPGFEGPAEGLRPGVVPATGPAGLHRIRPGDDGGLNDYGRPFHQRATEMVVPPLSPADVGEMLGLSAADAFDAYLVSGGLPLILDEWPTGPSVARVPGRGGADPTSALLVSGERALAAEFPPQSQAGLVLRAIGSGERTFSLIARRGGGPSAGVPQPRPAPADRRSGSWRSPPRCRPSRRGRPGTRSPTRTCGSGWRSWARTSPRSSAGVAT